MNERDLFFLIVGASAALSLVCLLIWPIAGIMARLPFRRGPRLVRIEEVHADAK